jgi:hypothetical protein
MVLVFTILKRGIGRDHADWPDKLNDSADWATGELSGAIPAAVIFIVLTPGQPDTVIYPETQLSLLMRAV